MEIDKKVLVKSLLEAGSHLLFMTGLGMIIYAKLNSRVTSLEIDRDCNNVLRKGLYMKSEWAESDIEKLKQRVDSLEKSNKK